jgi:hypothetical protein
VSGGPVEAAESAPDPDKAARRKGCWRVGLICSAPLPLLVFGLFLIIPDFERGGMEMAVPQHQAKYIQLFTPERRLPGSARNVRVFYSRFLDAVLFVRFDAPLGEARAWTLRVTGAAPARTNLPSSGGPEGLDWWVPEPLPPGAEGARGEEPVGVPYGPVRVILLPDGNRATVWAASYSE